MKRYLVLGMIPLVAACSREKLANATGPTSVNKAMATVTSALPNVKEIAGVAEYQEKCSLPDSGGSCIKIVGGDDFNDKKTFYLNSDNFEVLRTEDGKAQKVRIFLEDDEDNAVEIPTNQHVTLLAKMDASHPEVIGEVESLGAVAK